MLPLRPVAPQPPSGSAGRPRPSPTPVAVIGGGVAGLTAARGLVEGGLSVTVFDKGRAPGGRLATRRHEGLVFDHGAQCLTARDPAFASQVQAWAAADVVRPWRGRLVDLGPDGATPHVDGATRWVGLGGMSAVARHLAEGLDVRCPVRVDAAVRSVDGWHLTTDDGDLHGPFDALIVALPPAQAAPLLSASATLEGRARVASMSACVAIMVAFATPFTLPWDGAFVHGGPLGWAARERSKPGRRVVDTWVLHGAPAWSAEQLERSDDELADALLATFAERAGRPLPPVATRVVHRWRYALPDPALAEMFLFDAPLGLAACGDWCGGPSVEGAWLSGRALARRLLASRPLPTAT